MLDNKRIAVIVEDDKDKIKNLTSKYHRNGAYIPDTYCEAITIKGDSLGCYASKDWYLKNKYTLISYEDYERIYENKELQYEIC